MTDNSDLRDKNRAERFSLANQRSGDFSLKSDKCNDGEDHRWQPLSFSFETQLLDGEGRVLVRQPDLKEARVYCVCLGCNSWTWVVTEWVGYYRGGDGFAGPDPVLGTPNEGDQQ